MFLVLFLIFVAYKSEARFIACPLADGAIPVQSLLPTHSVSSGSSLRDFDSSVIKFRSYSLYEAIYNSLQYECKVEKEVAAMKQNYKRQQAEAERRGLTPPPPPQLNDEQGEVMARLGQVRRGMGASRSANCFASKHIQGDLVEHFQKTCGAVVGSIRDKCRATKSKLTTRAKEAEEETKKFMEMLRKRDMGALTFAKKTIEILTEQASEAMELNNHCSQGFLDFRNSGCLNIYKLFDEPATIKSVANYCTYQAVTSAVEDFTRVAEDTAQDLNQLAKVHIGNRQSEDKIAAAIQNLAIYTQYLEKRLGKSAGRRLATDKKD